MRTIGLFLLASLLLAAVPGAQATPVNNLRQIGLVTHNGENNLKQIVIGYTGDASYGCSDGSVRFISGATGGGETLGDSPPPCDGSSGGAVLGDNTIACGDGSVRTIAGGTLLSCGDGSVRTLPGDGSVRFISVDTGELGAVCFSHVTTGGITDGTSNTIQFGEGFGLRITPGFRSPSTSVRDIVDGSSNTILFGETPASGFCLGDTTIGDPVLGSITDGTSNTIFLGEDSSFDVCFRSARFGKIADGTSNTLLFGDKQSNVCLENVLAGADLAAVPEPTPLTLLLPALTCLGIGLGRCRRS